MEGTRRRGRPGKTWRDEVEKAVSGGKQKQARARDRRKWWKGVWEAKAHTRTVAIERLRRRTRIVLLLLLLLLLLQLLLLLLLLIIIIINIRYFRIVC